MKPSPYFLGFDNNSFHPDDGDPTVYNGNDRLNAFPTTAPLRSIRIFSNEPVSAVRERRVLPSVFSFLENRKIIPMVLVHLQLNQHR